MVQASWRRALVGAIGALLLGLGGCSAGHSSTRVDEKWLARVPDSQMEGVRVAQLTQAKATDQVTRARVAVQDAEGARKVAHHNVEAAKSRQKAADAALETAHNRGDSSDVKWAQEALQGAEQEAGTAKAELTYRDRAVTTLKSLEELRKRELAVADAELAQEEYLALQRSGDARAEKLSGEDFSRRVAEARRKADEAQRQVDGRLQEERQARAEWQQLRNQAQGIGGGGAQGP